MAETFRFHYPIPGDYLEQMNNLLGADYLAYQAGLDATPAPGLRVNTLKTSITSLAQHLASSLQPLSWCPSGFVLADDLLPGKHPYHAAGLYYLQDPAAMAVAEILAPQPGERVLDLSAAPGGKSTHLASLMSNQGWLAVNEIHPQRVWELAENLERWGATHVTILNETPARLADHFGAFFDRVLIDAPCSGEGMFRKSEAARRAWSPELVQSCALRQANILAQAVKLVRPGGWLAYATCTFNPQENEAVIAQLLREHPEYEIVEIPLRPGFDPGRPDWAPGAPESLSRAVRLWPYLAPGEGHFVALLQKSAHAPHPVARPGPSRLNKVDLETQRLFSNFCQASLNITFNSQNLVKVGSYLYNLPENLPDLGNLNVIHPGWWLGVVRKGRFEPSHALALALRTDQAKQVVCFESTSAYVAAYLRGETLPSPGEDGWILVCVDGFALGWGKRVQGVVKNFYPRGLRRQVTY